MTLEMTEAAQEMAARSQGMSWEQVAPAWQALSANWANQAVGEVQVFLGPVVSANSIFSTIEAPALVANPNVTGIVFH